MAYITDYKFISYLSEAFFYKIRKKMTELYGNPDKYTTRISAQNFLVPTMCTYPGSTVQ